jgi:hypothetical protein
LAACWCKSRSDFEFGVVTLRRQSLDERDLRIQHAAGRAGSGLMAMLIIAKALTENVYIVVRYRREHV